MADQPAQLRAQALAFRAAHSDISASQRPPPFRLDTYATHLPMQAEAFASQIPPHSDVTRNPAAYQARRFRSFAKEAESVSQFRSLNGLLDIIVNSIEDLPADPAYLNQLAEWKHNYSSLESRVDQVQKPPG